MVSPFTVEFFNLGLALVSLFLEYIFIFFTDRTFLEKKFFSSVYRILSDRRSFWAEFFLIENNILTNVLLEPLSTYFPCFFIAIPTH